MMDSGNNGPGDFALYVLGTLHKCKRPPILKNGFHRSLFRKTFEGALPNARGGGKTGPATGLSFSPLEHLI